MGPVAGRCSVFLLHAGWAARWSGGWRIEGRGCRQSGQSVDSCPVASICHTVGCLVTMSHRSELVAGHFSGWSK
eukprot:4736681-Alexandrium_andersonii.AAC.1